MCPVLGLLVYLLWVPVFLPGGHWEKLAVPATPECPECPECWSASEGLASVGQASECPERSSAPLGLACPRFLPELSGTERVPERVPERVLVPVLVRELVPEWVWA